MKRNNHPIKLLQTALSVAILMSIFSRCSHSEGNASTKKTAAPVIPVVETFLLEKGMLSTEIEIPGELFSFQQVDLYAHETSFVKKLHVDVGSEVKEGQLLVSLDAPEITSRLAGAESRWKSQESVYKASKASYERLLETSKTPGTISPNDLDQAQARMNSDYDQLQAAKAGYREISNNLDYLEIRAPFNGVITARNVNPGAYVGPSGRGSERPLFTLQEQKHLRLVVSVPEAYISYLQQNDEVSFQVKALPQSTFKATVKRQARALDTRLRAERVEMDVQNDDKKLLPGMVADVTIPLPARDSTFIVPKAAVLNSAEGIFVIRVKDAKTERIAVKIGRTSDGKTEIFGDLTPGDKIVATGSEEIKDGTTVSTKSKV
ncbi:efflux RND transporter periplasmic adaptor subunit [Ohtaekwangia koreensis]|uniref:RND family efflux transporter, MFP subunit n=1 Tax=Ohtaekwangia koreensis TaxID=688867 RepID=A0A1T5MCQ5_9BACT|nr:efflux RND transporter periplasmic adaptor subunit [Ohtaekwangia koreensis]SKC85992.1 RND family efflux transporter, MFP subunit [Ohtaekwangia koreensis]